MGKKFLKNYAIVILGASGNLTQLKLIPALGRMFDRKEIDESSVIIGSGRTQLNDLLFRNKFSNVSDKFKSILYYHRGISGMKEFIHTKGDYQRIIFFFALPPSVYASTARELSGEGMQKKCSIIIEKPFGCSYDSAHRLNSELNKYFDDSQIYRIDHYLAKEAVQNILVFRFANYLFSQVWNNKYIESIQISAYEKIGIEGRGAYFDKAGIIRDMVQNHLVQLICLLTMDAPVNLTAEELKIQKKGILKVLRAADCSKYQYEGYTEEKGVSCNSKTETYAELKLFIDNLRWSGVPIHIRTGKCLDRKGTEIGVKFKAFPKVLYNKHGEIPSNKIIFKIQPAQGIIVALASKTPGSDNQITSTNMSFCYRDSFDSEIMEAYERLLFDALKGDKALFVSAEETELSWKVFDHIFKKTDIQYYKKGTVPKSCFCKKWIEFEKYASVCS